MALRGERANGASGMLTMIGRGAPLDEGRFAPSLDMAQVSPGGAWGVVAHSARPLHIAWTTIETDFAYAAFGKSASSAMMLGWARDAGSSARLATSGDAEDEVRAASFQTSYEALRSGRLLSAAAFDARLMTDCASDEAAV